PPPMSMTRMFTTSLDPAQKVVRLPSSCSILPIGLYTKVAFVVKSPPQRIPASFTELVPELMNTGEPLSPASTLACTQFWQNNVMLVPSTLVSTHVSVSEPLDHPVVRPTLFAVFPTEPPPSEVIEKLPEIVSAPVFTAVVFSIRPRVWVTPETYAARAAS